MKRTLQLEFQDQVDDLLVDRSIQDIGAARKEILARTVGSVLVSIKDWEARNLLFHKY